MASLKVGRHQAVPGEHWDTPKEIWGFTVPVARGGAVAVARRFLKDNAELFGLEGLRGQLEHARTVRSLGATHVLFRQRYRQRSIHRSYVTVHLGAGGRIYLAKNRALPARLLTAKPRFVVKPRAARRTALRALRGRRGPLRVIGGVEEVWFPRGARVQPAYKVRVHCERPREEWIVFVDAARKGRVLQKYDNLAQARGLASVFDPNPVAVLPDWRVLRRGDEVLEPPADAYRLVRLEGLSGSGRLDGDRVTTRPTRHRVRRADGRFVFENDEPGFEEAMVYFHVDRAIRYLERIGFSGPHRIFRTPLPANVRGTRDDNSWYSPGTKSLTFGTGGVDDAEDGETILHEFGHAIQDAICPDFGQSAEAAAMGEGFGDYFAGSFFAGSKPEGMQTRLMSWDAIGDSKSHPPYLRRLDTRITYRAFDPKGDEHDNGLIWSATLWDVWRAVGRTIADRIILESHFQLDGFTTMARGARAILDADRNLYRGQHVGTLRRIFRGRHIGPL